MLPKSVLDRSFNGKVPWKHYCLDAVFQNFECKRKDVFSMENPLEGTSVPPVACSFSKVIQDVLALADEDGNLIIMNTLKSGPSAIIKDWHAHSNAIFDLDWMPGEGKLVTASGDQTLALWDVEVQEKVLLFSGHTSSVKSVAFHSINKDLLISGSRDGHIMLWDRRINRQQNGNVKFIHDIPGAHDATQHKKLTSKAKNSSQYSVTAVAFQNENTFASAGCVDGTIKLWDLRKMSGNKTAVVCKSAFPCQSKKGRPYGISNLIFDHAESYLFASCLDGSIYQYDCLNYKSMPVTCYRSHKVSTFFVKLSISPDDKYIMSGSSDSCAYIWPIRDTHHLKSHPEVMSGPIKLVGHDAEVTSVAWCQSDILRVITLSDDNTACIWRPDRRDKDERFDDVEMQPHGHAVKCHIKSILSTPKKCFFTSPIKKSPSSQKVLKSLNNLPSNLKLATPSPTITSFFSKSSAKKPTHITTPKMIILSPRKGLGDSGVSLTCRGVKRKLCVDNDEVGDGHFRATKSAKMQKTDNNSGSKMDLTFGDDVRDMQENIVGNNPLFISDINLSASSSSQIPLKERSPNTMSNDISKSSLIEKDLFHIKSSENLFARVIHSFKNGDRGSSTSFSSPTANLPNFVKDSYYKKRQEKQENNEVPKNHSMQSWQQTPKMPQSSKINWLMQLSLKKNSERSSTVLKDRSPMKMSRTPVRSKVTRSASASPKTMPRTRKR